MEKLEAFIKKYPIRTGIMVFTFLLIVPPLIINSLYKKAALWKVMEYVNNNSIPPGNLLSYFGTVLTFIATFSLSIAIYLQNKENNLKTKLATNATFITIKEGISIKFLLPYIEKTDKTDMFFGFKINVLSKAAISEIYLDSMYFGYNDIDAEKNGILMNFEPPEVIAKNRAETELDFKMHSFGIPNNIVEFIKSRDEFGVRLDTRIKCNDVVTPVIIFLQLEKQKEKCEIMTFYFIAKSTYARHETPEIEK